MKERISYLISQTFCYNKLVDTIKKYSFILLGVLLITQKSQALNPS